MIKINRYELKSLARIYILSNTPFSLLKALMKTNMVEELRENCGLEYLKDYYEMITSRAKRDEISMGLSYAVMVAFLTHKNNNFLNKEIDIDITRLKWGVEIKEHLKIKTTSENIIEIDLTEKNLKTQQFL